MQKIIFTLLCSLVLTSCSIDIDMWEYLGGQREYNGLIYEVVPYGTAILGFTSDLQDDEIVFIPPVIRHYLFSDKPIPVVFGSLNLGTPSSDALKVLYVTGGQTTFVYNYSRNLPNLKSIAINSLTHSLQFIKSIGLDSFLAPEDIDDVISLPRVSWIIANEVFEELIQYAHDNFAPEAPDYYVPLPLLVSSRASYYYNYDNSPNEGLYRIGIEYEIGIDLTPPEDPTREGYQFIGWSSDAVTFIPYDFATSENDVDVQLYAHWE